jgi:hypothetical protein
MILDTVDRFIKQARESEREAAKSLAEILPPGTKIEFRVGNMSCVQNATVLSTSVARWPEVHIRNDDTGIERTISPGDIVPPDLSPPKSKEPIPANKKCEQCGETFEAWEGSYKCPCCKRILCAKCVNRCKRCRP